VYVHENGSELIRQVTSKQVGNKIKMCIFTSDKDIPGHVRLTTRTLQYLIIPLLSAALLVVGILHVHDCSSQPLLPVWHIVAGSTGLVVPLLYLLFDDLNPALAKRCPALSEALDNVVVFVLPVYIIFEIAWLVTGTVWLIGVDPDPKMCDKTIHVFSMVVVINFWIHILTPLLFMLCLCCTKICPFLGHCTYWNVMKGAIDMWTRPVRITIVSVVAVPLGLSMISVGGHSLQDCDSLVNHTDTEAMVLEANLSKEIHEEHSGILSLEMVHIPIWLLVAGILVLAVPLVYYIYDAFCKPEDVNQGCKRVSQTLVIIFLLAGLAWAVVGFLWIFGDLIWWHIFDHGEAHHTENTACGSNSATYMFAFACLIILNCLMDIWICFKICVILYWALISGDD